MAEDKIRVLVLEPYFGGSHRYFIEGMERHLPFEFLRLTMPARKWKWRMRLAAPLMARELAASGQRADLVLCSTFIDVAAFRGLAPSWVGDVPVLTYFHENQLAYPVRAEGRRDNEFSLTNITTALASDSLAFNSHYNLESFLKAAEPLMKKSGDMSVNGLVEAIRQKSSVLPPPLDYTEIDEAVSTLPSGLPVVLWNHRWEHDKDPEGFFEVLFNLDEEGVEFGLIVLGESFDRMPDIFKQAQKKLASRVVHFGYVECRKDYARWLGRGSVVVSTARHEFFGLSVLEAVRAGCRPLLPRRLSYPELFPDAYLYDAGQLRDTLKEVLVRGERLAAHESRKLTDQFSWDRLGPAYERWFRESLSS